MVRVRVKVRVRVSLHIRAPVDGTRQDRDSRSFPDIFGAHRNGKEW